ncbi:hypothetical protein GCM10029978_064700 [Actinoallomurus acanthiterrae]
MRTDLIARARAGDSDAFRELPEPYRQELHVHCSGRSWQPEPTRGIGRALVEQVLSTGAKRVYAGTRRPRAHPNERVTPLTFDVTDKAQIHTAVEPVKSLDLLIKTSHGATPQGTDPPRRRRRATTTIKESLRAPGIRLPLLNHQVSAHADLKDVDLYCLDLISHHGPLSSSAVPALPGLHPATRPASSTGSNVGPGHTPMRSERP